MLHQAFHDVHKAPSRCCQQWTLTLAVLCVHMAVCLAECPGYCWVSVPCSTMQRGLLLLVIETQNVKVNDSSRVILLYEFYNVCKWLPYQPGRGWPGCCTGSSPHLHCHNEPPHEEQSHQTGDNKSQKHQHLKYTENYFHVEKYLKAMMIPNIYVLRYDRWSTYSR